MFIYLASPYTNNPHENFENAEQYTAEALKEGECIFSPIVHCHEIAQKHGLPHDFGFWVKYNYAMLEKADQLRVLKLVGWKKSVGVQAEIAFAEIQGIPIEYVHS